jgi:hypothetical protein
MIFLSLLVLLSAAQASLQPIRIPVPDFQPVELYRIAAYKTLECEDGFTPPEPITTPDPVVNSMVNGVVINFVIGSDGRVYGPMILQSDSPQVDVLVFKTVEQWRFRPATCNGEPVETEAAFQFTR